MIDNQKVNLPYLGPTHNSTGVALSDIAFSFMLETIYYLWCIWSEVSFIWG